MTLATLALDFNMPIDCDLSVAFIKMDVNISAVVVSSWKRWKKEDKNIVEANNPKKSLKWQHTNSRIMIVLSCLSWMCDEIMSKQGMLNEHKRAKIFITV